MKRWATALGIVAMALTGLALAQVKNPNTLVNVEVGDWYSFDPAWGYSFSSWEVLQNTYETLIFYKGASASEFEPMLATQVPSKANGLISKDGLTYKFPIRQGVTFQNGDPLTAEDVAYSIRRVITLDANASAAWMLEQPLLGKTGFDATPAAWAMLAKAVYAEGNTVVFHLAKPFAPFLAIIASPVASAVDKRWVIKHGGWPGTGATDKKFNHPANAGTSYLTDHVNGTGPFKLELYNKGKEVVLERNNHYWRAPAKLERVVLMNVSEYATRRLMIQNGSADLAFIPRANLADVRDLPGIKVAGGLPDLYVGSILMNQHIKGAANPYIGSGKLDGNGIPANFFANTNVRRGFAYAFGYKTYVKQVMLGKAIPLGGPIPDGLLGYSATLPKYTYQPAVAAKFFKAAFGGKLWDTGFKLIAAYYVGNVGHKTALEILKSNLAKINPKFRIEIKPVSGATYDAKLYNGQFAMFTSNWGADYADPYDFVYPFYDSQGFYGLHIGYNNPKMDKLIAQSVYETVPAKRVEIFNRIHQLGFQDALVIWLGQRQGWEAMRSWVKGWYFNPIFALQYYYPIYKQ